MSLRYNRTIVVQIQWQQYYFVNKLQYLLFGVRLKHNLTLRVGISHVGPFFFVFVFKNISVGKEKMCEPSTLW